MSFARNYRETGTMEINLPEKLPWRRPGEEPGRRIKLSVKNLNFYYGNYQALKDINIDIPENTVTAFIGPSGCGKSTLLRTFNRMYELYPKQTAQGEILLDGKNILSGKQNIDLLRGRIGMVFQKPTPFPMSIFDNIAFSIKLYEKLSRRDMEERVELVLRKAALWRSEEHTSELQSH